MPDKTWVTFWVIFPLGFWFGFDPILFNQRSIYNFFHDFRFFDIFQHGVNCAKISRLFVFLRTLENGDLLENP